MKPTLENVEELLDAACESGGSGEGISHYRTANACGMRAHLSLANKRSKEGATTSTYATDPDKLNSLRVGSAYHKLHEWWSEGALDKLPGLLALDFTDVSFNYAMRLFEQYAMTYPKRYWGRVIKNEWLLPESEEARAKVHMTFNRNMFNAKPDRVVYLSEADIKEIDRCTLDGPGYYVIDFKTSGVEHTTEYWQSQAQALWYPHALKMEHPDWDVKGLIFDVIRKPASKKQVPYFECFYVPMRNNAIERLYPFVVQGASKIQQAKDAGYGNVTECVKSSWGKDEVCPYYENQCELTRRIA